MANDSLPFLDGSEPQTQDEQVDDMVNSAQGPDFSEFSPDQLENLRQNYLLQVFVGALVLAVAFLLPGDPFILGVVKFLSGLIGGGLALYRLMQINGINQALGIDEPTSEDST